MRDSSDFIDSSDEEFNLNNIAGPVDRAYDDAGVLDARGFPQFNELTKEDLRDRSRKCYEEILDNVRAFRKARVLDSSFDDTHPAQDMGWFPELSVPSYALVLESFYLTNYPKLDIPEKEHLEEKIGILRGLRHQAEKLTFIYTNPDYFEEAFGGYDRGRWDGHPYKQKYSYDHLAEAFVDEQFEKLKRDGKVYLIGGTADHFEVYKIKKRQPEPMQQLSLEQQFGHISNNGYRGAEQYDFTVYNAGFGAEDYGEKVKGFLKREVKTGRNPEALERNVRGLMRACVEKYFRPIMARDGRSVEPAFWDVMSDIHSYLGEEIKFDASYGQLKGNCTIRSQREVLNHGAPGNLAERVREYITDTKGTDVVKILNRLRLQVQRLEKEVGEGEQFNIHMMEVDAPYIGGDGEIQEKDVDFYFGEMPMYEGKGKEEAGEFDRPSKKMRRPVSPMNISDNEGDLGVRPMELSKSGGGMNELTGFLAGADIQDRREPELDNNFKDQIWRGNMFGAVRNRFTRVSPVDGAQLQGGRAAQGESPASGGSWQNMNSNWSSRGR